MATKKYLQIPIVIDWSSGKDFVADKNEKLFTNEVQKLIRTRAVELLDTEYLLSPSAYSELTNDANLISLPRAIKGDYFKYDPAAATISVSVLISDVVLSSLGAVRRDAPSSALLNGATDFVILEFDETYSDNSIFVAKLRKLKAVLTAIVEAADKIKVDLYKEKYIIENIDAWKDALVADMKEFYEEKKSSQKQASEVNQQGLYEIAGSTKGPVSWLEGLVPILCITFPDSRGLESFRAEARNLVEIPDSSEKQAVNLMEEVYGLVEQNPRESSLNSDEALSRLGFEKQYFGFSFIKNLPAAAIRVGESEFEAQITAELNLEGSEESLGNNQFLDTSIGRTKSTIEAEYYPTFVNYIRNINEIIDSSNPISDVTSGFLDGGGADYTDLMPFLEAYHYPKDISIENLQKIEKVFDEADALYKGSEDVEKEKAILSQVKHDISKLYDQVTNAPFDREDAINSLAGIAEAGADANIKGLFVTGDVAGGVVASIAASGLHEAYGSLLSDGFNFSSLNEQYDAPWLSYPGNAKIRPSHVIRDSTVAQISSGRLLSRIKTIKDIENLIVKRLTVRDLLILGLTCADRYGTPNVDVLDRIDKFLVTLGNTRIMPAFKKTTPIGDFWGDFTNNIEGVIKETVERAIVDFFKQMLIMIASCNVEGVGDQFKKGAADLGDFLTNKDDALLKFADHVITKSMERSPKSANLLRTKKEIEKLAKIVTNTTTPLEMRDCLQGNANNSVIEAIARGLNQQLGIRSEKAAVESGLASMGREDCNLSLLDEKIDEMARMSSAEICADFKQQMKDKYSNYDDGLLDEIIGGLPDKNPESALAFDPEFVLQPCELLKIPDPAGDFMNKSAYQSAFDSIKTKFTVELNAFPVFLFDSDAISKLNITTNFIELDDKVLVPSMSANKGGASQKNVELLVDFRNLLKDEDNTLVEVISNDFKQEVRFNTIDPMAKLRRLFNTSGFAAGLEFIESLDGIDRFSELKENRAVAALSLTKKTNAQNIKNNDFVNNLEYDKEIILKNKIYSGLSPDGASQYLIDITGLHSIEIDNQNETLSLRIKSPNPSAQLEQAMKALSKTHAYPDPYAVGIEGQFQPSSQAERFSQVMTDSWKPILGQINEQFEAQFRASMRAHYSTALDTLAGRFSKKSLYSPFLDSNRILTMTLFDDPLCPTKQVDLMDLASLTASMETIRKNFICQGLDEQAALQRAIMAGLTKTFMRVLIYEKFLPSIFYFSEIGLNSVNKEIYMGFIFSLFCAEVEDGADDILSLMAQASYDILTQEEAIEMTNTDALKLLLEKTLYEVSDKVKENIQTVSELDIDVEKFGEVSDSLFRRILDTPVVQTYGVVQPDLKNKALTDDNLKIAGRTVYPEVLNVPTFVSMFEDPANQALDIARYLSYAYNGPKNDELLEVLSQASQKGTIDLNDMLATLEVDFEKFDVPPNFYNNELGRIVSIEKQILKNNIDQRYFKDGGFVLEQFIEVKAKLNIGNNQPKLKNIPPIKTSAKKVNFNSNPMFSNLSAEEAVSQGIYGQISDQSFDYVKDFLEIDGAAPLFNGYVGLDDFYSLATVTNNLNEGFSELSAIDKELFEIFEDWKQFRYRPTAIPKKLLNLTGQDSNFKNINNIDSDGNVRVFKSIATIGDLAKTDGLPHVPLGAHRLVDPNTSKAKKGANFSFYIGGDSINNSKRSVVRYTPNSFVKFEADLSATDWSKWSALDIVSLKDKESALFDSIISIYQVMLKKQGTDFEQFKTDLLLTNFVPYTGESLDWTDGAAPYSPNQGTNLIHAPASFSVVDTYLQKSWLNVLYIQKYLNLMKYYVEYESKFTWNVWDNTAYENQDKIVLGKGDIDNPITSEDCYAVFAKIYEGMSSPGWSDWDKRFHIRQLIYDSEQGKWRLSLKSSLFPRLILYMENKHSEDLALFPIEKDLKEFIRNADFSNVQDASESLLNFLNLQYAIPKAEEGTPEREEWDKIFDTIYPTIELPFGESKGISQIAELKGIADGTAVYDLNILTATNGEQLQISSNLATSYVDVNEIVFNLNAEELYWHFDHALKGLTFYGLFADKSIGANLVKWSSCIQGFNYYPYELVEREIDATLKKGNSAVSRLTWRQFSNPDVEIIFPKQITTKNLKKNIKDLTSLPLLDYEDVNYEFSSQIAVFSGLFGTDINEAPLFVKPSLLFGKTTIHQPNSSVTNFKSLDWMGENVNMDPDDIIQDSVSEHMSKRYHPDYLHEETSRVGFKVLTDDVTQNALPERNILAASYKPQQYSRIWGIKSKNYAPLLNESLGSHKDWDPDWDSGFWVGAKDAGLAIMEGVHNLFGFSGLSDENNPGPKSVLYFLNQFKEIWTEDHGRRRATLDTLLLNMKFYLNQIQNYDTLPKSHMNDWSILYISDAVDNFMNSDESLQLKSIRIGRPTPSGKFYEINSMTNNIDIGSRGLDYDQEIGATLNKFMSIINYDTLYGQDFEAGEEAVYTPVVDIPLVRAGAPGVEGEYLNMPMSIDKFAVHMNDAALFATGMSKTNHNNMYNSRTLYYLNPETNEYERISGEETIAYKLLKNWYDKIEELRDKRAKIINNLRDKVIKFMPAVKGSEFFADEPHTTYYEPLKAGVRLSYVLPVSKESEESIPSDGVFLKNSLSDMIQARRAFAGSPGRNYPPLYKKSYEIIERETKQVTVDDEQEVQTINKEIYKIPIAESKIKISDIYGVEDKDIPLSFALQLGPDGNILYDYNKVYEEVFKLKEELLKKQKFQVLFGYSLPVEDLATLSALGTYNTIVDTAKPGLSQMFSQTKSDLLNTMTAFSLPLSYDSAAEFRSYEEQYAFSTADPVDATGIDQQVILQASLMILKGLAEISDPTIATAKAIKDTVYQGVKTTIKAGEAAFGGDASSLYDNKTMRYWRSSQAMFPIVLSLLPYPLIPQEVLFAAGITNPFHITPLGMTYWGLSVTGKLDPLDGTLTAGYHSNEPC